MSLLKVDTIKPVTSGADLSLQGDSGGSAIDCLNITSAGDINFTGNTDAKIKMPSAGGIYESDGSTAILTESGGAVTLDNVTVGSSVDLGLNLVKISSTTVTSPTTIIQISSTVNYDTYFGIYRSVVVDESQTDGQIQFLTYTASSIHTWKASTSSFGMTLAAVRSTTVNSSYPTAIPLGNNQLDSNPITNRLMTGCFWIYGAQDTDSFIVADC